MNVSNLAACDGIVEDATGLCTLVRVRGEWSQPPSTFAVWLELQNPSERAFTLRLEIWRGKEFVGETEDELVLAGVVRAQRWRQFSIQNLQPKTYKVVVLIDDQQARILTLDFGAKGAP